MWVVSAVGGAVRKTYGGCQGWQVHREEEPWQHRRSSRNRSNMRCRNRRRCKSCRRCRSRRRSMNTINSISISIIFNSSRNTRKWINRRILRKD